MWSEKTKNGKVRFIERYENPLTGASCRVSVTMDKDTASTRKAALQALQAKIDSKLSGKRTKEKVTVSDLADAYLAAKKNLLKRSSYDRTVTAIGTARRILGSDTLVESITAGYIKSRLPQEKPGTMNRRIKSIKSMLRWGYENDYLEDVRFLDKIKPQKDLERREKLEDKFLEPEELSALLVAFSHRPQWQMLTEFLALSGLRIGEAIALTFDDVDLKSKTIYVSKTYDSKNRRVDSAKTAASEREVYMQPELEAVCRKIRAYTREGQIKYHYPLKLFLCDINGDHVDYYAYYGFLSRNSERVLGRSITPHVLRHTHVSSLAASGISLDVISRRLGHEDSEITRKIYLHVTRRLKESDREVIANLA